MMKSWFHGQARRFESQVTSNSTCEYLRYSPLHPFNPKSLNSTLLHRQAFIGKHEGFCNEIEKSLLRWIGLSYLCTLFLCRRSMFHIGFFCCWNNERFFPYLVIHESKMITGGSYNIRCFLSNEAG